MTNIQFTAESKNIRLDQFLSIQLQDYSRTQVQDLIKRGSVVVNGASKRASYRLQGGEQIEVLLPDDFMQSETLQPENIPLDIVWEDDSLVVVNKPAGIVVHPGAGVREGTLVNGLAYHFQTLSDVGGSLRPGLVHRLDRDTSGLIVIAKTNTAHNRLAEQFQQHTVQKTYIGITWGKWKSESGQIDESISRRRTDPTTFTVSINGRWASTSYEVVKTNRYLSEVLFTPKTGRTHQIRVHAAFMGHPIFADEKYHGGKNRIKGYLPEISKTLAALIKSIGRHALHAWKLIIQHPVYESELQFIAPIPEDMKLLINSIKTI